METIWLPSSCSCSKFLCSINTLGGRTESAFDDILMDRSCGAPWKASGWTVSRMLCVIITRSRRESGWKLRSLRTFMFVSFSKSRNVFVGSRRGMSLIIPMHFADPLMSQTHPLEHQKLRVSWGRSWRRANLNHILSNWETNTGTCQNKCVFTQGTLLRHFWPFVYIIILFWWPKKMILIVARFWKLCKTICVL